MKFFSFCYYKQLAFLSVLYSSQRTILHRFFFFVFPSVFVLFPSPSLFFSIRFHTLPSFFLNTNNRRKAEQQNNEFEDLSQFFFGSVERSSPFLTSIKEALAGSEPIPSGETSLPNSFTRQLEEERARK